MPDGGWAATARLPNGRTCAIRSAPSEQLETDSDDVTVYTDSLTVYSDVMTDDELEEHLARVARQGSDDARVEVKAAGQAIPKNVWETVSAFANTSGGAIILGLDESREFAPSPGFDAQRIIDALDAGLSRAPAGAPKVQPVPDARIQRMEAGGAPVAVVEIDSLRGVAGIEMPCHVLAQGIQRGSYKRVDDKDVHLSTYEVYLLQTALRPIGVDREPVAGRGIQDLSTDSVAGMLERQRRTGSHALDGTDGDTARVLRRLNVLTSQGLPTVGGYLALGSYPQDEFPQLVIDVSVHPGTEKSVDASTRFIDRTVCDGPIPLAIDDAVRAVLRNLRTRRVVTGVGGHDVPEIPEEVLREAVTNAVTHRDYSEWVRGQQVAVDVYADRVEVTNPGGFWGDRTATNVFEGRSSSRNEVLAKLLTIVPRGVGEGTVCESQGSGVPRMVHAMREMGLPAPDFGRSDIGHVTVTLSRFGLMDPDVRAWLDSLPGAPRPVAADTALSLARTVGRVGVVELRESLGVDSDDARRVLAGLTAEGLIEGSGDGPYALSAHPGGVPELTDAQKGVLDALDPVSARTIRDIAAATGRSPNTLRPILRILVEQGRVLATAPVTSRHRAYLSVRGRRVP